MNALFNSIGGIAAMYISLIIAVLALLLFSVCAIQTYMTRQTKHKESDWFKGFKKAEYRIMRRPPDSRPYVIASLEEWYSNTHNQIARGVNDYIHYYKTRLKDL